MRARIKVAEFNCEIPGKPAGQGNPQRITSKYSAYPPHTVSHRNLAVATLAVEWSRQHPNHEPLAEPVGVWVAAYFTRPRSHFRSGLSAHILRDDAPSQHISAPDADKLARLVLDALTVAGVVADDRYVARLRVDKWYAHIDRTRITVQWGDNGELE